MKAFQITGYGGSEVYHINEHATVPEPNNKQVLIQVHAVSVNPIDIKVRAGIFTPSHIEPPYTLGGDFSGVITKLGEGVENFKIGDEVYGRGSVLNGGEGAFAEYVTAKESEIALKPKNISHTEAAGIPLVGSSAVLAIFEHLNLQSGQKILIHGAAGGIGSTAVQIAKSLGAYIAATASGKDKELVKSLGADIVVDYKTEKFEDFVKDFDAVFDTVGGETYDRSFTVLKRGGTIVSMLEPPRQDLMNKFGVIAILEDSRVTNARLDALSGLVESGALHIQVDKVFPFEQTAQALGYFEKEHSRGKVVITLE